MSAAPTATLAQRWAALLDPVGFLLFTIAFLNALGPFLPPGVWRALAVSTSGGLIAVKAYVFATRKAAVQTPGN